jgi:hypothetical protein
LTNRETALGLANETIKKLEKANQGLEYGEPLSHKERIDEELIMQSYSVLDRAATSHRAGYWSKRPSSNRR